MPAWVIALLPVFESALEALLKYLGASASTSAHPATAHLQDALASVKAASATLTP
jgi:hypothetical protein